jgi:hypothetical protein
MDKSKRFVLKERASIDALSSLISRRIVGKRLSRPRRSFSSMLLMDFGRLIRKPHPKRRDYFVGEWHLLVEWSDWAMTVPGRGRITSESEEESIDKMLPALARQTVTRLDFNRNGRLALQLQNGASFICSGKGGPANGSPLSLWVLLTDVSWSLAFACNRTFVVRAEPRLEEAGPSAQRARLRSTARSRPLLRR